MYGVANIPEPRIFMWYYAIAQCETSTDDGS